MIILKDGKNEQEFVECRECGVLVNKYKAKKIETEGEYVEKEWYFCKHCRPEYDLVCLSAYGTRYYKIEPSKRIEIKSKI